MTPFDDVQWIGDVVTPSALPPPPAHIDDLECIVIGAFVHGRDRGYVLMTSDDAKWERTYDGRRLTRLGPDGERWFSVETIAPVPT